MGVLVSHGAYSGSYTGFNDWRRWVIRQADLGWTIDDTGIYHIPEDRIPDQPPMLGYPNSAYLGVWDNDPTEVLDVLMVHSDCEGTIPWRFTQALADRLASVLGDHVDYNDDMVDATLQFVTGLLSAHARHEDVEFA